MAIKKTFYHDIYQHTAKEKKENICTVVQRSGSAFYGDFRSKFRLWQP